MNDRIWIDGFNVLRSWKKTCGLFAAGKDFIAGQNQALRILAEALGATRSRVRVYMDGGLTRTATNTFGLSIRWAGPGKKADDLMIESMQMENGPKITIVTNDRDLGNTLYGMGARLERVDHFLKRAIQTPRSVSPRDEISPDIDLSPNEVDAWLEIFEEDEE